MKASIENTDPLVTLTMRKSEAQKLALICSNNVTIPKALGAVSFPVGEFLSTVHFALSDVLTEGD